MIDDNEKIRRVELKPYDSTWPHLFTDESTKLSAILQENRLTIHHIGSTAIPGIYAKPIIDILPVVKNIKHVDLLNDQFEAMGYTCMGEYGITGHRFYWKSKEKRTHHVHLFQEGSPEILHYLAFRDFLLSHDEIAPAFFQRNAAFWTRPYTSCAYCRVLESCRRTPNFVQRYFTK